MQPQSNKVFVVSRNKTNGVDLLLRESGHPDVLMIPDLNPTQLYNALVTGVATFDAPTPGSPRSSLRGELHVLKPKL